MARLQPEHLPAIRAFDVIEIPTCGVDRPSQSASSSHSQPSTLAERRCLQSKAILSQISWCVASASAKPQSFNQFASRHTSPVVGNTDPGLTSIKPHINPDGGSVGCYRVVHQIRHRSRQIVSDSA